MTFMNLQGKKAFVVGIGDDHGFGWAIAKALYAQGAEIIVGTWAPIYKIFTTSLKQGKFDESRKMPDGTLLEFSKIYPIDAMYDTFQDVPPEIQENKRYKDLPFFTIEDVKNQIMKDFGRIDILVHSLANAPEVKKCLLETSRNGYLAAMSSSSYSFISLVSHFGPLFNKDSAVLALSYIASERVVPKYGGGMSSAKAALESDVRTLAYEAGRKWGLRINAISAGPLKSRAAKAIGMIEDMIEYYQANAPIQKELTAEDVANAATFLLSPFSSAITGEVIFVDHGMHAMGVALDSPCLQKKNDTASV